MSRIIRSFYSRIDYNPRTPVAHCFRRRASASYEIVSVLGAGGMGEVYRARDTKLGREVAIKVILDVFAADPDRIARFEREAKVLASLNHPHIAALYGLEQSGAQHFLVMELVEGQTLAERLLRGPMPVDDALAIARQIADALEAAHEKGIVHRDLKPANVKITPDEQREGAGLRSRQGDRKRESAASLSNVANSPTLSRPHCRGQMTNAKCRNVGIRHSPLVTGATATS